MEKNLSVEQIAEILANPENAKSLLEPLSIKIADLTIELNAAKNQMRMVKTAFGIKSAKRGKNGKTIDLKYNKDKKTATFGRVEKPGKVFTTNLNNPAWQKDLTASLKADGINGDTGGTIRGIIQRIREVAGISG